MQVSMCLAYQPVQLELSIFGKSINFSLEDPRHNERLSLTLSHTQVEALTGLPESGSPAASRSRFTRWANFA